MRSTRYGAAPKTPGLGASKVLSIIRNRKQGALRTAIATATLLALVATACIAEDDLTFDQRHRQLSEQLMCPVCDGQTIDQSSATLSEDMKTVIWEQLEDGRSNAEIRGYFVERYGESVLAAPTSEGLNLTAWILPAFIAAAGLAIVGAAYFRMRSPSATSRATKGVEVNNQPSDDPAAELDSYLARVDAEMEAATGKQEQT